MHLERQITVNNDIILLRQLFKGTISNSSVGLENPSAHSQLLLLEQVPG